MFVDVLLDVVVQLDLPRVLSGAIGAAVLLLVEVLRVVAKRRLGAEVRLADCAGERLERVHSHVDLVQLLVREALLARGAAKARRRRRAAVGRGGGRGDGGAGWGGGVRGRRPLLLASALPAGDGTASGFVVHEFPQRGEARLAAGTLVGSGGGAALRLPRRLHRVRVDEHQRRRLTAHQEAACHEIDTDTLITINSTWIKFSSQLCR